MNKRIWLIMTLVALVSLAIAARLSAPAIADDTALAHGHDGHAAGDDRIYSALRTDEGTVITEGEVRGTRWELVEHEVSNGAVCTHIVVDGARAGSCRHDKSGVGVLRSGDSEDVIPYASSRFGERHSLHGITFVQGFVPADTVAVDIVLDDGRRLTVNTFDGEAGRYFAVPIEQEANDRVRRIEARGSQ